MDARFLITDIVRAIKNKEGFKTSAEDIVRDFITPPDFYNLVQTIVDFKHTNTALDCYTKSPFSKFDLLSELASKFGLKYEIDENVGIINATGIKLNYYSLNKAAKSIGHAPGSNSINGIVSQISLLN